MKGKKLSRRDFLRMGALTAAGAALVGCVPLEPAEEAPTAVPPEVAEEVEVTLWQHTYAPLVEAYETLIAEFEEANPNVTIVFDSVAAPEFEQKLLTAMAAETGPDIFRMPSWSTVTYVDKEMVKPLDPQLLGKGSHQEIMDEYDPPSSVDGWVVNGELYAIPIEISVMSTWFRLDIMQEELGVDRDTLPKTWPELWDACVALTQKDDDGNTTRVGFSWSWNPIWTTHHLSPILWQQGGSVLNEDGTACALDSPEGLKAVDIYADVYRRGGADKDFEVPQAFETGIQVISFSGPFMPSIYKMNAPEMEYGTHFVEGPWMQTEGGTTATYMWGPASLTPNPDTENVGEVYDVMKFIWDRPEVFWEIANIMATRKIFKESEAFRNSPWLATFMADAQTARPAVKTLVYEEVKTAIFQMLQRVVYEDVPSQEAITLAAEDINNALAR